MIRKRKMQNLNLQVCISGMGLLAAAAMRNAAICLLLVRLCGVGGRLRLLLLAAGCWPLAAGCWPAGGWPELDV
jgi:hypothetical protein